MASIQVNTDELVAGAIAHIFSESDPKALAEAMAKTVLASPSGSYRNKDQTVLEEIVGEAVRTVAREVIRKIITEERREEVEGVIRGKISEHLIRSAATEIEKKLGIG